MVIPSLPPGFRFVVIDDAAVIYCELQADGAYPNGARVVKVDREAGEARRVGATGTVIGSIAAGDIVIDNRAVAFVYWIAWDTAPQLPVAVVDWKVARGSRV